MTSNEDEGATFAGFIAGYRGRRGGVRLWSYNEGHGKRVLWLFWSRRPWQRALFSQWWRCNA
jgi:hypothetical protein